MGCASSKRTGRHRTPYVPLLRSRSLSLNQSSRRRGDSCHVAALPSTTNGSFKVDGPLEQTPKDNGDSNCERTESKKKTPDGIREKTWADMINQKTTQIKLLPLHSSTPTVTPQNEPETINTWELMEGLEDSSPPHLITGETTNVKVNSNILYSPKPLWLENGDDSIGAEFDPGIISTFRKPIEEFGEKPVGSPESDVDGAVSNNKVRGIVQARISAFQGKIDEGLARKSLRFSKVSPEERGTRCPPGGQGKVVLYFTSLRGIRKTYEDCCYVRMILQGLGVPVDERDVSMHYGFREELNGIFGRSSGFPRLFVKGKDVGGAEEVRRLHEAGELGKTVKGCGTVEPGLVCAGCGEARFVLCERCSGSCKVFDEEGGLGFMRCPDCNENGIVRCPLCC